jgi:cell division septal protein FtsQ
MSSLERDSSFGRLGDERLHARRRRGRRRALVALCVFIFLLLCAGVWKLRQPAVRISHIKISSEEFISADTQESLVTIATTAMQGNYFGVIPRDSIFFFPGARIRANILAAHPEFAAISISRNWMTGLSIVVQDRVPIARWCASTSNVARFDLATSSARSNLATDCYLFDANGFIFATTSPLQTINSFVVFSSLGSTTNPVGSTLPNADKLPTAFNFARQLSSFGATVSSIVFRGDEVDDYVTDGTRITYVLGDEQNAFTELSSARNNFNLSDGSVEYIDLRFDGKIYIKNKND